MDKKRPFLKWAGNKYRILHHIAMHLPPGKRLLEPFAGTGAVFLNTQYQQFLLADQNLDLVNLYNHIKTEGQDFIEYCRSFFSGLYNNQQAYQQLRQEFNQSENPRQRSALFLYLNRHAYNGLCRYNLKGGFNVPFGAYIKPYFPTEEMLFFREKSQQASFIKADFRETFAQAKKGDVIYCDPPYAPLSATADFVNYTGVKFSTQDQIDLADLAQQYAKKGIPVLISNHDTPFTRELYQQAHLHTFEVRRTISCKGSLRTSVPELIAVFE